LLVRLLLEPPSAQSPFARSKCYLSRRGVSHHVSGHYPTFLTTTGSCANPQPSRRLGFTLAPRGLDRSRARSTVSGGFPSPPFRLRGGFTFPPWPTFPKAPVVIPVSRISQDPVGDHDYPSGAFPIACRFKYSPTYARYTTGLPRRSIPEQPPHEIRFSVLRESHPHTRHDRESLCPFEVLPFRE
jgi:hypothetical protein